MSRDDEGEGLSRHSGKGHKSEKMIVVFVLVLGLILGAMIAVYAVFPEMNKEIVKQNQDLVEKNKMLEKEADSIIQCLQDNDVDYYTQCK